MKNTSTIQEHDIKVGVTLNAFIKKAPKGFASLGEYLSARKLKHGKTKISRAHGKYLVMRVICSVLGLTECWGSMT